MTPVYFNAGGDGGKAESLAKAIIVDVQKHAGIETLLCRCKAESQMANI